jgi:hypothetical protein
METIRRFWSVAMVVIAATGFMACAADNPAGVDEPGASGYVGEASPSSPVVVRLYEFTVRPSRTSVPAGGVSIHVINQGTEEH